MQFTLQQTLDATPQALFDVISDPRRRHEWQSSLESVNVMTEGPARLGTRWSERVRGGLTFELEITEFERPRRWAERGLGRAADAELRVSFEPAPGTHDSTSLRTLISLAVEIQFKGMFKWAAPVVRVLMPIALSADLRRAAALARDSRKADLARDEK